MILLFMYIIGFVIECLLLHRSIELKNGDAPLFGAYAVIVGMVIVLAVALEMP